jgi:hypothetical protein
MKAATRGRQLPEDTPPKPLDAAVRVLYIGGWGRSGSTLLDLILGQAPGVFSAGEVREIWQSGLVENRPCGCERPFRSGKPGSGDGTGFPWTRSCGCAIRWIVPGHSRRCR